jgi:hypothetical protein
VLPPDRSAVTKRVSCVSQECSLWPYCALNGFMAMCIRMCHSLTLLVRTHLHRIAPTRLALSFPSPSRIPVASTCLIAFTMMAWLFSTYLDIMARKPHPRTSAYYQSLPQPCCHHYRSLAFACRSSLCPSNRRVSAMQTTAQSPR